MPLSALASSANHATTPTAVATFTFPNRILFGSGASARLAVEIARLGIKRPLIVTDNGLRASGIFAEVADSLGEVAVFLAAGALEIEDATARGASCWTVSAPGIVASVSRPRSSAPKGFSSPNGALS